MISIPVDTDNFRVDIDDGGIAHLVFGPAGGMPVTDARGHAAIASIWRDLDARADVRVVLVRSEGRAFCAGGALDMVEDMLQSEAARRRVLHEARELVAGMLACGKPIVSAIHGAAVGAGLAVALLADISIAAKNAKLIDGHTKLGVAAGDHAAVIWPLLCGMAKAKYYLMTAEFVNGKEAERIGLVSLCVPRAELMDKAMAVANKLANGSQQAIRFTKRSLNGWMNVARPIFESSLAMEMLCFLGEDAKEGVASVREKRAPKFPSAQV